MALPDPTANLAITPMTEGGSGNITQFNKLLYYLDALAAGGVESVSNNGSDEDNAYIVGASPAGNFAGMAEHDIAWHDGDWKNVTPQKGWEVYNRASVARLRFNGTTWVPAAEHHGINDQSGTTYTLSLADAGNHLRLANASPVTCTVPPNSSVAFPIGTRITLVQAGAGQVTVDEGAGVTVNSTPGLKISAQWGGATLTKVATDTWDLVGDLSA